MAIIALVLTVSGSPPAAVAQGVTSVSIAYLAEVDFVPAKNCVGDTVHIKVRVDRQLVYDDGSRKEIISQPQNFIWVNGAVQDPSIGTLTAARQFIGFDLETSGEVEFEFIALKPGTTRVNFAPEPPAGFDYVGANVDVNVELCKLQVANTSIWRVPGEANLLVVAKIRRAELVPETPTHLGGVANVKWYVRSSLVVDCREMTEAGTSTAVLIGDVDEDDQLKVTVTFLPADVVLNIICINGETALGDQTVSLTGDPVEIVVPLTGGKGDKSQDLIGPSRVPGTAIIGVWPARR